jgi:GTPase SAR1 family protein
LDPNKNPFAPGAGTQPPELAGRTEIIARAKLTLERVRRGRPEKSFLVVGLRGVGKTVVLNRIREIAEESGYRTINVEAVEDKRLITLLIPKLRQLLLALDRMAALDEKVKRALRVLTAFAKSIKATIGEVEFGLSMDPEVGSADSGDLELDLPDLFEAIGIAAKSRDTCVVLIIDELQYATEQEMSALIMSFHRIAQRNLPFVLIGGGLPQLVALAGKSKSYAERLFDYPRLERLQTDDAKRALREPIEKEGAKIEEAALEAISLKTLGYPYFLQEWGYQAWNNASGETIRAVEIPAVTAKAINRLDESFFRVRFDRLTPSEQKYMFAMAKRGSGPHRSGDIAAELRRDVQSVAPIRSSLIRKGMIYSPTHGDTAFTVPMFDEYLQRVADGSSSSQPLLL